MTTAVETNLAVWLSLQKWTGIVSNVKEWRREEMGDKSNYQFDKGLNGYETKDSGQRQLFDSGMQRDVTEGKIKWHLVFSGPMLERWAELMTRGAVKYDDDNWMKACTVEEHDRFKQSAFRHFMQWYAGDGDEDHAAAVMFNINGAEYVEQVMTRPPLPLAYQDWSELAANERRM